MLRGRARQSGWQGAGLIAVTYVYFLIFAQFAFLKRLTGLGVEDEHLKAVLAAMAAGGILLSLLTPRLKSFPSPNLRLRIGLLACGAAAFLSLLSLNLEASIAVAFLIGAGLGTLTVTLVTHLRQWTGNRNPLLLVGLGTGSGYLACNIPGFFAATAESQCAVAGVLCLAGIAITFLPSPEQRETIPLVQCKAPSFLRVLACFAALVWLDSAAFFIIQNNPVLKAGTWQGSAHLWANGLLHFSTALASAWLLCRRSLMFVLASAFLALGFACLLLLHADRVLLASLFYPIGVSLYSVALVAYPSLLAPAASTTQRGLQAGWIYAIAGWCGSAMGIGMGQNLGHVPPGFVLGAGAVVLVPGLFTAVRGRTRELGLTACVAVTAFAVYRFLPTVTASSQLSQVERGRQVYISEGCINCHSQYVRPNSPDVLMWGPTESIAEIRLQQPPLIGNRRQGPDLAEVGARRSAAWLKAHFFNPAEVSGASIMPSFGFLFNDQRGDDLVAYLVSLHGAGTAAHQHEEGQWQPAAEALARANNYDGQRLFGRYCATCHSAGGQTRWQAHFKRMPPDLTVGPFLHLQPTDTHAQRIDRLAQIAKFGIPGTDMPGHEYLPDTEIASISLWLSKSMRQPVKNE